MKLNRFQLEAICDEEKIVFDNVEWKTHKRPSKGFTLSLEKKAGNLFLELKKNNKKNFTLNQISYDFEIDLINFGRVLIPDSGRFYMNKQLPRQVWDSSFHVSGIQMINPFFHSRFPSRL